MDLFEHREAQAARTESPLAARMRPRDLSEYVGQSHIMAPGRLLRRAIEADRLSSLIFYGPPGTGKTTLAEVIARRTEAHFTAINAVLAGVKELRVAIAEARTRRGQYGLSTVLFVDEVHRFNKAQQDALLPWVERGTVILIGATTENPYFEVNKALVSRSRIFQLQPLTEDELSQILDNAINDGERGYGYLEVAITRKARAHLINVANGDARSLLNALELAVETTPRVGEQIRIDLKVAEESIQQRAVLYDKEGDAHYDTISAFIKSLRGSDPDAALYWLARMVYAGEDPRFIFRRLTIFASEDIGLAQPEALGVVMACASAFDRVGMPEGRFHLAQATLYAATALKSNSTLGFFDALRAIEHEREGDVPNHLKDGKRDKEGFGHGKGYLYPHAYKDHWVAQQYLPGALQGRVFYEPSRQGYESSIHDTVHRRRDAQLAAAASTEVGAPEILTVGVDDEAFSRWLRRTEGEVAAEVSAIREEVVEAARLARHHVTLDLHARSGLLTWELSRSTPEGGVFALCHNVASRDTINHRASSLGELRRPVLLSGALAELPTLLDAHDPELRFDAIVGHNALVAHPDKASAAAMLAARLREGGRVVLYEGLPARTQRLYDLINGHAELGEDVRARWIAAEEAIYADASDPLLAWDEAALEGAFIAAGFAQTTAEVRARTSTRLITQAQLDHWFPDPKRASSLRPSYAARLRAELSEEELDAVEGLMRRKLSGERARWGSAAVLLVATREG